MKKQEYTAPIIEVNAFAQFENVFTFCNKTHRGPHHNPKQANNPNFNCIDITESGNAGDYTGGGDWTSALGGSSLTTSGV